VIFVTKSGGYGVVCACVGVCVRPSFHSNNFWLAYNNFTTRYKLSTHAPSVDRVSRITLWFPLRIITFSIGYLIVAHTKIVAVIACRGNRTIYLRNRLSDENRNKSFINDRPSGDFSMRKAITSKGTVTSIWSVLQHTLSDDRARIQ
jgi:hypothetical protein